MYITWTKGDYMRNGIKSIFWNNVNKRKLIIKLVLAFLFLLTISIVTSFIDSLLGFNILTLIIVSGSLIIIYSLFSKEIRMYNKILKENKSN